MEATKYWAAMVWIILSVLITIVVVLVVYFFMSLQ